MPPYSGSLFMGLPGVLPYLPLGELRQTPSGELEQVPGTILRHAPDLAGFQPGSLMSAGCGWMILLNVGLATKTHPRGQLAASKVLNELK